MYMGEEDITMEEVRREIKLLKNGKAGGIDGGVEMKLLDLESMYGITEKWL